MFLLHRLDNHKYGPIVFLDIRDIHMMNKTLVEVARSRTLVPMRWSGTRRPFEKPMALRGMSRRRKWRSRVRSAAVNLRRWLSNAVSHCGEVEAASRGPTREPPMPAGLVSFSYR